MTTPRLDHIGIAVADLDTAIDLYRALGFSPGPIEELPAQGVRLSFCPLAPCPVAGPVPGPVEGLDLSSVEGGRIELLSALGADTPIGRYLAARGPGIHHLCFRVDDIRAELARLADAGFFLIDRDPRAGAHGALVAFLHPRSTGGVLIELSQRV
jgi:methylmalonyl-CoA/ethylmalonyl-CoA epimerase